VCVVRGGWIGVGRGAVSITGRACWPWVRVLYGTHGCWVAREDACGEGGRERREPHYCLLFITFFTYFKFNPTM
jgi:hypothetical protein